MTMEHDIDDGLTDEERLALVDDEGDATDNVADPKADDAEAAAEAAATDGAEADAAKAAADAAAAATAAAATTEEADQAAATAEATQAAPILIAPVVEDAAAKLAEIDTKKEALLNQFDDGDITMREYQKQVAELDKDMRLIERAQDRAELAGQMEQQRLQNDWNATCAAFVSTHAVYKDNARLYKALDAEVRELATKPETAQWTGQQFLTRLTRTSRPRLALPRHPAQSPAKLRSASSAANSLPIWPRCPLPTCRTPTADALPCWTAWRTRTQRATRKLSTRCRNLNATHIWPQANF